MNISYNWLKRYIDFDLTPRELAAALTSLGLECDQVEEVESIRGGLRGLTVGKVLTCVDHPDSDHLHVTTVDLGTGEPVQIVCGAPNVAAGQTVVVATIGTKLYDGDKELVIKKSKMRGVESFGMICAEDEIGLGDSHDGIMVLPDDVPAGTPAAEYFKMESDWCLEVELTPNRVDAASHYGTARDLRAWIAARAWEKDHEAGIPEIRLPEAWHGEPDSMEGAVSVTVDDTQGCPRYSGITIRDVEVKESPDWLKKLLIAVGQRPINNIVDITNFVLLGIGQPLHCFDLSKVKGEKIVVRTCPAGTKFTTLDGTERTLHETDLMICDEEKPMCIAGVFGGLDSGVTENTTDVFIESAYFNSTRVRRTARRHGLSTDASFRYERGTDPEITIYAVRLAAFLIKELAGGRICGDIVDEKAGSVEHAKVELSLPYTADLIGKKLPKDLIIRILKSLEIDVQPGKDDETLMLNIPPYRVDVTRPCDVVEEILRVYGYNNVEFGTEMHANLSQRKDTDFSYALQQTVSDMLTAKGFSEILNNSLSAERYYADSQLYPIERCVRLLNPLSGDLAVMRQTLLFGGLESVMHNVNRKAPDLKFYEFGNVYSRDPEKQSTLENPLAPFKEHMSLALWITGRESFPSWNSREETADVFYLKSIILDILRRLGVSTGALKFSQGDSEIYSVCLNIDTRNGRHLGELGILRKAVLNKMEIEQEVCYAQLDWDELYKLAAKAKTLYTPLAKTQPVKRDLALLIDKGVSFDDVVGAVAKAERKLLRDVTLFDVYEGEKIPGGKKSYAISIVLQDDEKTLNDRQIDAVMKKIIDSLTKNIGAELR